MKPILKSLASKDALGKKVRKSLAACGLGIFLLLALVPNDMKAQPYTCPGGFTDGGCYTYHSWNCDITVCYCWRLFFDPSPWPGGYWSYEAIPERVTIANCDTTLLTDSLFNSIDSSLLGTVDSNVNQNIIPPCDSAGSPNYIPMVIKRRLPLCWKKTNGGALRPCSTDAYCELTCNLCYTLGHILSSNCTTTIVGTDNCSGNPPPGGIYYWVANNCYYLPCVAHP